MRASEQLHLHNTPLHSHSHTFALTHTANRHLHAHICTRTHLLCGRLPKSAPSSAGSQPELDPKTALRTHYWMDLASVYPVLLLGATPGMTVLVGFCSPTRGTRDELNLRSSVTRILCFCLHCLWCVTPRPAPGCIQLCDISCGLQPGLRALCRTSQPRRVGSPLCWRTKCLPPPARLLPK